MKHTQNNLVLLGLSTFLLVLDLPAKANPIQPANSFTQWCMQKNNVPIATHRTINILLKKAGTSECQQADIKLSSLKKIDLYESNISDLSPLASFPKLEWLILSKNQISDLRPLSNLNALSHLFLSDNNISDIKPLSDLKLSVLYLNNNPISGTTHYFDIPVVERPAPPPPPPSFGDKILSSMFNQLVDRVLGINRSGSKH
jgi:Leucine-rich repeat (LRR) protein